MCLGRQWLLLSKRTSQRERLSSEKLHWVPLFYKVLFYVFKCFCWMAMLTDENCIGFISSIQYSSMYLNAFAPCCQLSKCPSHALLQVMAYVVVSFAKVSLKDVSGCMCADPLTACKWVMPNGVVSFAKLSLKDVSGGMFVDPLTAC